MPMRLLVRQRIFEKKNQYNQPNTGEWHSLLLTSYRELDLQANLGSADRWRNDKNEPSIKMHCLY